ncbi:MAG: hypothetical protein II307_03595 [Alistipes sp.]|nr:hypothetical protein [Alistipes sp.]
MIKRLIGIVGTLGVVAIVVFTILGRGEYSSALSVASMEVSGESEQGVEAVVETNAEVVDSLNIQQQKPLLDSMNLQ